MLHPPFFCCRTLLAALLLSAAAWGGVWGQAPPSNGPLVPRVLEKNDRGIYDLTFDDISFEMEKDDPFDRSLLTEQINALNGQRITLRGFIHPTARQTGNTRFIFVRDNQQCCFGPGAALCDCVLVSLREGNTVDFTVRPITVTGTFVLKEYKIRDKVLAIFRMKESAVE